MPDTKKRKAGAASVSTRATDTDQAARERIRTDLDTTFLVEAGAGSGKTRSLVDRMVALIAGGRATIQTMAAVTFTRKAAAELRGRFQLALERSLQPQPSACSAEERKRLAAALRDLEQGFIGTIHSFCARLLRERPVECGIDPEFEELDDLENAFFREECWHDYLVLARLEADQVLRDLDDAGLSPDDLKDAFEILAGYPEVLPAQGRLEPPGFEATRSRLGAFLDAAAAVVPNRRPEAGWDEAQMLLRRLFGRRGRLGFTDPRLLMESIELLDKNPRIVKKNWPSKEVAEALEDSLRNFREEVVAPVLRAWREFRHAKALAFLAPALKFYEAQRRAKSRLNFQDQLLLAAELLRESPEVRRYFQNRYRRVLVDEFQDTDPIQAEVLFYLTGRDAGEKDWTKLVPLAGSLFLVGDPKQSIYRFRRADIDIYNVVKDRIAHGGGEILKLTANFRSLACIADWVNPIVEEAFPASPSLYQAEHAPLVAKRPGCHGAAKGVFKITVAAVARHKGEDIAQIDAARIAEFIARACAGGLSIADGKGGTRLVRPEDFLVLFRYKKHMDVYARALEAAGVPYEIAGSNAFAESREIDALVNLLQALKDPGDPVASVTALKGVFFGASDQDLLDFRSSGGEFTFAVADPAGHRDGKVGRAFQTLREWREWTVAFPPSVVLEMILETSGLLNHLVTDDMGNSRAGNVLKLVEVVRSLEIAGTTSFAAVADFLVEDYAREAVEEMSLTPGRADAVRMMNLHKAKGLEAPVVFLANPLGQKEHDPDRHIIRRGGSGPEPLVRSSGSLRRPLGYFQFRKRARWNSRPLSEPEGWAEMSEQELEYGAAEEARLMYVAATRAGDILVVSSYESDLGAKKAWSILDSALNAVPELTLSSLLRGSKRQVPVGRKPPAGIVMKPAEYHSARQEILRRRGEACLARYRLESVTSLSRQERPFPEHGPAGLGMAWGSAVHIMLNAVGRSRPVPGHGQAPGQIFDESLGLLARNALLTAGLGVEEEEQLGALVREIIHSEFWARAMKAETHLFEVPFSVKIGPDDPDYGSLSGRPAMISVAGKRPAAVAGKSPIVLTGTIDLAFLEDDGWVIADYKTDRLAEAATEAGIEAGKKAFDELVAYYRPQVSLYDRFWQKVTGQTVKESGLYFTSLGLWFRIS